MSMMRRAFHQDGTQYEGDPYWKIAKVITSLGYNEGIRIETATITQVSPIKFRFGDEEIEIEEEDCVIADHLLEHTRTVSIGGRPDETMVVRSPLKVGDPIIVISSENGQLMFVMDKAVF